MERSSLTEKGRNNINISAVESRKKGIYIFSQNVTYFNMSMDQRVNSIFKDYIVVRNRLWSDTAHTSILAPPFLPPLPWKSLPNHSGDFSYLEHGENNSTCCIQLLK